MAMLDCCSESREDLKVTVFSKWFYCGSCINMFAWSPDAWRHECILEYLFLSQKASAPPSLIKSGLKEAKGTIARVVVNEVQMFCLETPSLVGSSFQCSVWFLLSSFWPAFGCSSTRSRKWKTLQYKAAASPSGSRLCQRNSDINAPRMENP